MKIGGNTPCVELRVDDHILLFDAGTGIIPLGHSTRSISTGRRIRRRTWKPISRSR
jgi:phosphoribosyl 1,2-cyclic phosphodiesterase